MAEIMLWIPTDWPLIELCKSKILLVTKDNEIKDKFEVNLDGKMVKH